MDVVNIAMIIGVIAGMVSFATALVAVISKLRMRATHDDTINVKLYRNDRDFADHNYGPPIDKMLDDSVGGPQFLDRTEDRPIAFLKDSNIQLELHEDGPLMKFSIRYLHDFLNVFSPLITAWSAWEPNGNRHPPFWKRTVQIKSGRHSYKGKPTKEEFKKIVEFFDSLQDG
jgi:hypothetical protein